MNSNKKTDTNLIVPKSSFRNLDQLHAMGLAVILSHISQEVAELTDCGSYYQINGAQPDGCATDLDTVLTEILRIPTLNEDMSLSDEPSALENLAGILTVSLSAPYGRSLISSDLLDKKSKRYSQTVEKAVNKAARVRGKIRQAAIHRMRKWPSDSDWIPRLLTEYAHPNWQGCKSSGQKQIS